MKTFVIGDTHGCYSEFKMLLDSLDADFKTDRLIMLGDYIDRGLQSYELLMALQLLRNTYGSDHIVLIRGNHEQMAIDSSNDIEPCWGNGCDATLNSFKKHNYSLGEAVDFFKTMPLHYSDEYFFYVHAGVNPNRSLKDQSDDDFLWSRREFISHSHKLGKTIIFGHTPTFYFSSQATKPQFMNDKIALDTGCIYGYSLSALELVDDKIVQVHSVNRLAA